MTKPLSLKLHAQTTGYADEQLRPTFAQGVAIDRPFVLLAGPNGAGKSAVLRGIRSTIGLTGERFGSAGTVLGAEGTRHAKSEERTSPSFLPRDKPGAVFDIEALGWEGQTCYLFDSRAASQMANKASFDDDDMLYHISLIAGGGSQVSHGQFVTKTWNEAIEWACGAPIEERNGRDWNGERIAVAESLGGSTTESERWLLLDEPEGAIDIERLLVGMAALLHAAEIGKLRVFCSSHSLIFHAGLADHPKMQVIDLKSQQQYPWMDVQKRAMAAAGNSDWLAAVGKDIVEKITQTTPAANSTQKPPKRNIARRPSTAGHAAASTASDAVTRRQEAYSVYKKLPAAQKSALAKEGRFTTKGLSRHTVEALQRRKIMQLGRLTQLGHDVRKIAVLTNKDKKTK